MTSGATALQHARQSFAVLLPRFDRRCWRARSDLFIVASLAGRGDVRKHVRGIDTCLNMSWDKPMTRVRSVGASERREACVGGRRRTSAWSAFLCEFSTKSFAIRARLEVSACCRRGVTSSRDRRGPPKRR